MIDTGRAGRSSGTGGAPKVLPRTRVKAGDVVWFIPDDVRTVGPEPIPLDVLVEDRYLVVVNKPAGMVTHPGPGHHHGTLVSALLNHWPQVEGVGEYPRWGIVHRLDRDTSGAMVVALHPDAHRGLSLDIEDRAVRREYVTLVHGSFQVMTGTIEAPIDRRRARRFVGAAGRPAVTHYRRLASWTRPSLSLLRVTLDTGRTHQIRVHLESIGRYVVGDPVYGRPAPSGVDPGRVWLHAHRLSFSHPITGDILDVTAPLPPDLRSSLAALGRPSLGTLPAPDGVFP